MRKSGKSALFLLLRRKRASPVAKEMATTAQSAGCNAHFTKRATANQSAPASQYATVTQSTIAPVIPNPSPRLRRMAGKAKKNRSCQRGVRKATKHFSRLPEKENRGVIGVRSPESRNPHRLSPQQGNLS